MFHVSQREDVTLIDVTSDVDIVSSSLLEAAIALAAQDASSHLIVNLEACGHCDSTGLAVLLRARKKHGERLLVVMKPGSICRRIVELGGLADVFQPSPDLRSALSRARATPP